MDCTDDLSFLGTSYFKLLRMATRRDLAGAQEFFNLPHGQMAYVLGNLGSTQLEGVAGYGLPYAIANQSVLLMPGASRKLGTDFVPDSVANLTGWELKAFELAEQHWWISRDWAKRDLGVASILCAIRSHREAVELSTLRSRDIKAMAAASYTKMFMDSSLGMQSALLLADAEAATDRITVARCSSPLHLAA